MIDDPDAFVLTVLALEADDIPSTVVAEHPWVQRMLKLDEMLVDEEMVRAHDTDDVHLERRDRFVTAIQGDNEIPPLIALGRDAFLVDGFARLRALRLLGLSSASVLVQDFT